MILRSQNKYLYLIYTYDSNIIIHRYKYNKNTYTLSYYLKEIFLYLKKENDGNRRLRNTESKTATN